MIKDDTPPKILIVDDEPLNIEVLSSILEDEGEVLFATDAPSALTLAEQELPDIILLDVMMPDVDGYEACRQLKENPVTRGIPVVFVTALDQEESEARGINIGAVDYLVKPISEPITRARVRTHIELKRHRDHLARLAFLDGLTGIANRRWFDTDAIAEWRRARRAGTPLSVVLIDIDQFKHFNDTYGHPEGDVCLKAVAEALRAVARRPGDLVARYGGEEFACLLPETPAPDGCMMAERFRAAVEALGLPHEGATAAPTVTISLGIATTTPDHDAESGPGVAALIAAADRNLYRAKTAGRNRSVCD